MFSWSGWEDRQQFLLYSLARSLPFKRKKNPHFLDRCSIQLHIALIILPSFFIYLNFDIDLSPLRFFFLWHFPSLVQPCDTCAAENKGVFCPPFAFERISTSIHVSRKRFGSTRNSSRQKIQREREREKSIEVEYSLFFLSCLLSSSTFTQHHRRRSQAVVGAFDIHTYIKKWELQLYFIILIYIRLHTLGLVSYFPLTTSFTTSLSI